MAILQQPVYYGPQPLKAINTETRHGFDEEYNSEQFLELLASGFMFYFDDKRHRTNGHESLEHDSDYYQPISDWKITKDRHPKTVSAAIVMCLNLGVDPPGVIKTQPCARTEAWVDPVGFQDPKKAVEQIGKSLQAHYETLSLRTRYKQSLDPCVEDVKRFCNSLRRATKDDRILFHYNGHGVPQATKSGEIWVFNRGYTQYIPVSLYDLQTWLGAPCIYVWDCSSAGNIVSNFKRFVQKRIDDDKQGNHDAAAPSPTSAYQECIQLASCEANEVLPMNPELPADLFTCCLTCPIEISVKLFIMQSPLRQSQYAPLLEDTAANGNIVIPGKLSDRRTPLGELNWIFTAITDTIAWTSLPRPLFKRLFRQDLMVAALFRNFLLAKRIMPMYNCHPISDPPLPDVANHHMWKSWDLAIDQVLSQLVKDLKPTQSMSPLPEDRNNIHPMAPGGNLSTMSLAPQLHQQQQPETQVYQHSTFFEQHLTAFELWLKYGSNSRQPPEQLPIVLQVLLSQVHRVRALVLLSRFLDLGPWAVYLALSIGIFPYVLKLLQSPASELKPILVFIWARIMSIDYVNTQQELVKEKGYTYFVNMLAPMIPNSASSSQQSILNGSTDEQKAMCAFILSSFVKNFSVGQRNCFSIELINACLEFTECSEIPLLRQWCAILVGSLWHGYTEGKFLSSKEGHVERAVSILKDPIPEVRTAGLLALTEFIPNTDEEDIRDLRPFEMKVAVAAVALTNDASPLVRKELVCLLSKLVQRYSNFFIVIAFNELNDELSAGGSDSPKNSLGHGSIFNIVWKVLLILSEDPYTEVKNMSEEVVDYIMIQLNKSELKDAVAQMQQQLLQKQGSQKLQMTEVKPVIKRPADNRSASEDVPSTATAATSTMRNLSLSGLMRTLGFDDAPQVSSIEPTHKSLLMTTPYGTERTIPVPRLRERTRNLIMPLCSSFYDYASEYFQEPQMRRTEADEPGSAEYTARLWRRNRNESIISKTQVQKDLALSGDWKNNVATLENRTQTKLLRFTQFENMIVSADDRDNVTVFDWLTRRSLHRFSNGNTFGTKITDLKFLNEDDVPLLLVGSSDGVVKIYKDFQDQREAQVMTAWRGLTDLLLTPRSTGLLSEWQQSRGSLLVTGDVKVIRVWDALTEVCEVDIPAKSSSSITSLTSDQLSGNIITAGFGDGTLRVYDRRLDARDSMIKRWKSTAGPAWITNVHMQRGGYRELVSGAANGVVELWDIRADEPVFSFRDERSLTTVQTHEHAPVIATGTRQIKIWTTSGDLLSSFKNQNSSLLATTRSPSFISTLAFHPHRMMLAAASAHDAQIHIYECRDHSDEQLYY